MANGAEPRYFDVELAPKYGALLPVSRYSGTHAKALRHTCMLTGPGARDDPDTGRTRLTDVFTPALRFYNVETLLVQQVEP